MYCEYFKFQEKPFSLAPASHLLYMSRQHWEAIAHLLYGVEDDWGFVLLTGEIGTGKTTMCRFLLEQIPENVEVALIINPKLTAEELLATICDEFRITYPEGNKSIKVFVSLINGFLLEAHAKARKSLLIIDEAQCLSSEVLDQLRLLTNLETDQAKLLRIILIGQPELRDKLSKPELQQMAQRITARYHIGPLSKREVSEYVGHRLKAAGSQSNLFPDRTIKELYLFSKGIPRLINAICDRALLGAYLQKKPKVDRSTLSMAAKEVFSDTSFVKNSNRWLPVKWGIAVFLLFSALALTYDHLISRQVYTDQTQMKDKDAGKPKASTARPDVSSLSKVQTASINSERVLQSHFKQKVSIQDPVKDFSSSPYIEMTGISWTAANEVNEFIDNSLPVSLRFPERQDVKLYEKLIALKKEAE